MTFLCMSPFLNATIQVVAFHLRVRCMLGVFFVTSINLLTSWMSGSSESVMECMYGQTGPCFILSSQRVLENGVQTHVNSKGNIPSARRSEEGRTCDAASRRTANPTHYPLSYSDPWEEQYLTKQELTVWQVTKTIVHFSNHNDSTSNLLL